MFWQLCQIQHLGSLRVHFFQLHFFPCIWVTFSCFFACFIFLCLKLDILGNTFKKFWIIFFPLRVFIAFCFDFLNWKGLLAFTDGSLCRLLSAFKTYAFFQFILAFLFTRPSQIFHAYMHNLSFNKGCMKRLSFLRSFLCVHTDSKSAKNVWWDWVFWGVSSHLCVTLARVVCRNYLVHVWFSYFQNLFVKFQATLWFCRLPLRAITIQNSKAMCFSCSFSTNFTIFTNSPARNEFFGFSSKITQPHPAVKLLVLIANSALVAPS